MAADRNPKHWKLFFLYYNPEDRRILVPKHVPVLGWTLNFARPAVWAATALFFAACVAFAIVNNLHSTR